MGILNNSDEIIKQAIYDVTSFWWGEEPIEYHSDELLILNRALEIQAQQIKDNVHRKLLVAKYPEKNTEAVKAYTQIIDMLIKEYGCEE